MESKAFRRVIVTRDLEAGVSVSAWVLSSVFRGDYIDFGDDPLDSAVALLSVELALEEALGVSISTRPEEEG